MKDFKFGEPTPYTGEDGGDYNALDPETVKKDMLFRAARVAKAMGRIPEEYCTEDKILDCEENHGMILTAMEIMLDGRHTEDGNSPLEIACASIAEDIKQRTKTQL